MAIYGRKSWSPWFRIRAERSAAFEAARAMNDDFEKFMREAWRGSQPEPKLVWLDAP